MIPEEMTQGQIALVQDSFTLLQPMAQAAASVFCARLFELDPDLRRLFPQDLVDQKRKLVDALRQAVGDLSQPEALVPALRDLGHRHARRGVRAEDYQAVGAALLWTLERGLGEAFSPELCAAWTAAYSLLVTTLQAGAAGAAVPELAAA